MEELSSWTPDEAMDALQGCLKSHGLLRCMQTEVNVVRRALGLPLIDRDGYEEETTQPLNGQAR